jgi:UDP-2,4-diacetamido-2,4,6-trideoxy-beta-L-altropyranose hydrolase
MNHLVIRADSTSQIGTGHIMRCLSLAQAWQDKGGEVTFISHCESNSLKQRLLDEGMLLTTIEKIYPEPGDLECTLETLSAISHQQSAKCWLVLDGYNFDAIYQKCIKEKGYRILWIDDYGHADHYYADVVLNQNIYANPAFYLHREPYTQLLLGTSYALLRREFKKWQGWKRKIPEMARKVLVTLGGGDPDNVTLKVIHALKQVDIPELEAIIVIGPANPNQELLEQSVSDYTNFQLIKNAFNMPELMAWADLAISAGGSTCWELAFMRLPNLIVVLVRNQVQVATALNDYGLSINIGWHNHISVIDIAHKLNNMIKNSTKLKEMMNAEKFKIDAHGCDRIINVMDCEDMLLRKASIEDCELLFNMVNDSKTRQSAFQSSPILFDKHLEWYTKKLNDIDVVQFVAMNHENRAIGQIRFDLKNGESVIDISIIKDFRGLGYGARLIRKGVDIMMKTIKVDKFNAYVKRNNHASIKSFEKAGFSLQESQVINGQQTVKMIFQHENNR